MALRVKDRRCGRVAILDLQGKITLGEDTSNLRDEILSLLAQGETRILLNMAQVTYVDSGGLGELVRSYTTAAEHGSVVKLLNLGSKMHQLLQITKLHTIFAVYDDESAAVSSFDHPKP